jgi:hypothetical protein
VDKRRFDAYTQREPSVGYAVKWINANRNKFEQDVFFPPALSLSVSDDRYAAIVEACIPYREMNVSRLSFRVADLLSSDWVHRLVCCRPLSVRLHRITKPSINSTTTNICVSGEIDNSNESAST